MGLLAVLRNNTRIITALIMIIIGVCFQDRLKSIYNSYKVLGNFETNKKTDVQLFSEEQLAEYNGITRKELYISLLGSIYDVTKGRQHYEKGSTYHYFVGKDGSRAFVTGNFKDESADKDHVLNLKCDEISALLHWKDTFTQKYKPVGFLIGRYYKGNGEPTNYAKQVAIRLDECEQEKEKARIEELIYPPCNMEWSAEAGSRVWCSKTSGGVSRSWSGVPRLLYTPGQDQPRCVCVDVTKDHSQALFKQYDNCSSTAASCTIKEN